MHRLLELTINASDLSDPDYIRKAASAKTGSRSITDIVIRKKSIDARRNTIKVNLSLDGNVLNVPLFLADKLDKLIGIALNK